MLALALSPHRWTTDQAIALVAAEPSQVPAAIDKLRRDLSPVPRDRDGRSTWAAALDHRLRRLAAKIAPAMSIEQADAWCDAVVEALGDLPAMVALTAAKRAIHTPMSFLNEVEGVVRKIAVGIEVERRAAISRLAELQAALDRIENPPVALPAPDVVTPDEMAAIMAEFGLDRPPLETVAIGGRVIVLRCSPLVAADTPAIDERGGEQV